MDIFSGDTVICIVKADMEVSGNLRNSTFCIVVFLTGQREQFFPFCLPVVETVVLLLLKRSMIQPLQLLPQILIEGIQTEILPFAQNMKDSLFQNADSSFHTALMSGLSDLGGHNSGSVMFCHSA